jgi:putative SOS response-associated peptidase YedK
MCGRLHYEKVYTHIPSLFDLFGVAPYADKPQGSVAIPQGVVQAGEKVLAYGWRHQGDAISPSCLTWGITGFGGKTIMHARMEKLFDSRSMWWDYVYSGLRCIVLADSFEEQGHRFLSTDGKPFLFAGLWGIESRHKQSVPVCTIVTTEANRLMAPIHHRMPALINQYDVKSWLHPDTTIETLRNVLRIPHEDEVRIAA